MSPDERPARRSRSPGRRRKALEAFGSAAEAIGPVTPGCALFLVTRGQFSMLDMVLHVLEELGPAEIAIWTWAIADYEVEALGGLMSSRKVTGARLVVDRSAEQRNAEIIATWRRQFGADQVRVCKNHAKIARVWNARGRVLLRGSMNLNFNPRFEQADLTEGGEDFELVARLESELPVLKPRASNAEAEAASGVSKAWELSTLDMFAGRRPFAGVRGFAGGARPFGVSGLRPWAK